MKFKRALTALLAALFCLSLSSCSILNKVTSGGGSAAGEDTYIELSMIIRNPDLMDSIGPAGDFTIVARMIGDAVEETIDGEAYRLQEAYIARNLDSTFLFNLIDVDETFADGDFVKATATIEGLIYWTEDNKQKQILNLKVSKIEPFTVSEADGDDSPSFEVTMVSVAGFTSKGTFDFKGAHWATDSTFSDKKYIILYFDFTNDTKDAVAPTLDELFFFQGDSLLELAPITARPDDISPDALTSTGFYEDTYPGKTNSYVAIFVADPAEGSEMTVEAFDDEFASTHCVPIHVADSLSAM